MIYSKYLNDNFLAFAHRGGNDFGPENSLKSFLGAYEIGYKYLETDIHLSKDGHLVAFHDESLDRVTNKTGLIKDLKLSDIKKAKIDNSEEIPTLIELLDKHKNDTKVLTSGSLSFLVHKIGAKLGIENCFGTDPEYLEGQFTGRVEGRPNFSEEKVRRINKWMDPNKFDQIFSYSDSIHDLPLLEFADFPMAISPDKELRRVAKEREWLIDDRRSS